MRDIREFFRKFARRTAAAVGSASAFFAAVLLVVVWCVSGPYFNFSDTWQLVINTGTTIVTFLIVFLIQNTQNRDSIAIHVKLDELIRAVKHARNSMMDLEHLTDDELHHLKQQFEEHCQSLGQRHEAADVKRDVPHAQGST